MSRRIIISPADENGHGHAILNVVEEKRLFFKPSAWDYTLPEMYNFSGEELFFVEVPQEALGIYQDAVKEFMATGMAQGAKSMEKVMTLAKMENNIAAGGIAHKVNPAYGVKTSEITEYTFTTKNGTALTVKPQADQYSFFSNRGFTKILGVLKLVGYASDVASIMMFGANGDNKETMLPVPFISAALLPMRQYFDDIEDGVYNGAMNILEQKKKEGQSAVEELIKGGNYKKYGYKGVWVSPSTVSRLLNNEFNSIDDVKYIDGGDDVYILYKETETRTGYAAIIEAFFFRKID